jgi:adenine-specific DNA-methyltransferase
MAKNKYADCTKEELIKRIATLEKHRYGLVWEDKQEDVAEQCDRELPVLHEDTSREIKSRDGLPQNILIEGDNYHALYALNFTHKRKFDLIYIDPPYNTGKPTEWKYNDQYVDTNDRFRHSKWLSFMNKRLVLAKRLLKDRGVIFISIDDNEGAQLKMLCDKIFGEQNFVNIICQKSRHSISNDLILSQNHNFLLLYAKKKNVLFNNRFDFRIKQDIFKGFKNPDNDKRGDWKLTPVDGPGGAKKKNPHYKFLGIEGYWRYSKDEMTRLYNDGLIIKRGKTLGKKYFLKDAIESGIKTATTWWDDSGTTTDGTRQLEKVLGVKDSFNNPKPVSLISKVIDLATDKNGLVLDFFAGSGTTGHAVLELNQQDKGKRQFILCTNNENSICEEVTYPRIKKVIKGYNGNKPIPANLKYFKTEFVPQIITDNDKRVLVSRSTELLCLAENTFELIKQSKKKMEYAIFKNTTQLTAIIYDEDAIEKCKEELEALKLKGKTVIYVFSYDHEYDEEDFDDLTIQVEVKPIPEAILNVYRKNAKLRKK